MIPIESNSPGIASFATTNVRPVRSSVCEPVPSMMIPAPANGIVKNMVANSMVFIMVWFAGERNVRRYIREMRAMMREEPRFFKPRALRILLVELVARWVMCSTLQPISAQVAVKSPRVQRWMLGVSCQW